MKMKTRMKMQYEINLSQDRACQKYSVSMVWSVSQPQDPAEGLSWVTAVLLGSGGTSGRGLSSEGTLAVDSWSIYWDSAPFLSLLSGCQEESSPSSFVC